ncbi:hypothetical protein RRG08_015910 [Elysia crispata]|uniref:Uncharacterized protein n=1 Tax=Elysia crispata TaxID=231223 RepID=A0AAE1E138_9GAST|nr:hypothetical protein RRG08_015910 [Elysia crispata]
MHTRLSNPSRPDDNFWKTKRRKKEKQAREYRLSAWSADVSKPERGRHNKRQMKNMFSFRPLAAPAFRLNTLGVEVGLP